MILDRFFEWCERLCNPPWEPPRAVPPERASEPCQPVRATPQRATGTLPCQRASFPSVPELDRARRAMARGHIEPLPWTVPVVARASVPPEERAT